MSEQNGERKTTTDHGKRCDQAEERDRRPARVERTGDDGGGLFLPDFSDEISFDNEV